MNSIIKNLIAQKEQEIKKTVKEMDDLVSQIEDMDSANNTRKSCEKKIELLYDELSNLEKLIQAQ